MQRTSAANLRFQPILSADAILALAVSALLYVPAAVRNREIGTISEIAHMYPAC